MIKAIIFDVGGTYMTGSVVNFINRSYQVLGINKIIANSDGVVFDKDYNKGLIGYQDCFRNFFGVAISEKQMDLIKEIWMNTWAPTEEMVSLINELKQNYRLAILSNSDLLNSTKYTSLGWYSSFNPLILSHELHILKPDKKIYEITLDQLKLPGNECLFIDDQEKALMPARDLGIDTILYKSIDQLKDELKTRGII